MTAAVSIASSDTSSHVPANARTIRFQIQDHPRGLEGIHKGLEFVRERIDRGRNSRRVIEWSRQVLKATPGALEPRGRPDPRRIALALFNAIKKEVAFVRDPVDAELMMEAEALLCLDPDGACVPAGDCDDQIILLGACLLSAGVPIRLRLRFYKGKGQAHVTIEYDKSPRLADEWTCIDPSVDDGVCSDAPYEREIIMLVHQGDLSHGTFVGIGDPPAHPHGRALMPHEHHTRRFFGDRWWGWTDQGWRVVSEPSCETWSDPIIGKGSAIRDRGFLLREATLELEANHGNPVIERWTDGRLYLFTREDNETVVRACTGPIGALGDPPGDMGADAAPSELSPEEGAIWIQQAEMAKTTLDAHAAELTRWREAFIQTRKDLGLPAYDPPKQGEQPGAGDSPIHQYAVTTRRWTEQADKDEQKLLSVAAYMSKLIGEGLSGARPIYWKEGDLVFGGKDTDPYWIQMLPNADGLLVPMYVDPKTQQPTGQIGAVPILLVAGAVVVVALSLGAAWNMDKIVGFLAQRHHDDMLSEMAQRESDLIASGKATPEDIAKMKNAQAEFAKASVLPTTTGGFPWLTVFLVAIVGALGGAAIAAYGTPAIRHYHGAIKRRVQRRYEPEDATAAGEAAGESRRRYPRPHDPVFVRRKIRQLRHEGYPQRQAVAIAHRMDRDRAAAHGGAAALYAF